MAGNRRRKGKVPSKRLKARGSICSGNRVTSGSPVDLVNVLCTGQDAGEASKSSVVNGNSSEVTSLENTVEKASSPGPDIIQERSEELNKKENEASSTGPGNIEKRPEVPDNQENDASSSHTPDIAKRSDAPVKEENGEIPTNSPNDVLPPDDDSKELISSQDLATAVPMPSIGTLGLQKMSGECMSEDSALPPSPTFEGDADKMDSCKLEEKAVSVPSPPSSESGIVAMADGNESQEDEEESELKPSRKRASPSVVEEGDFGYSYLPKRMLRSALSPSSSKKLKYSTYDEQDYDTIRRSILKQSSRNRRKNSLKLSNAEKGLDKCPLCRQVLVSKQLTFFAGPPDDAVTENEALKNPDLTILGDGEVPLNRVVLFSIYDENCHLCPLDDGSVERGVKLHMSGFLKPTFDEDKTSASGGIPAKDIGPITEWWIGGYEEPEPYIGLSTDQGEYILGAPAQCYVSYLEPIFEKVFLSKLVIEFLNKQEGAAYEDLLTYVESQERPPGIPNITEDSLMRHAQFICDQVVSFDDAGFSDDESDDEGDWRKLITEPCMRSLIEFAGATVTRRNDKSGASKRAMFRIKRRRRKHKAETGLETWTKATTTPLVCDVFDSIFADQIDSKPKEIEGQAAMECNDSDSEIDVESFSPARKKLGFFNYKKVCAKRIDWTSQPLHISKKETYYSAALVGDVEVNVGDLVCYSGENFCSFIGRVQYMWEDIKREKCAHMIWFMYGKDTMLGESADPHEIFMVDRCEAVWLSRIMSRVDAKQKVFSKNWHNEGGLEPSQNSPSTYFYSKSYDEIRCRFEDIPETFFQEKNDFRYCPNCETTCRDLEFDAPSTRDPLPKVTSVGNVEYGSVIWRGETYKRGQSVYLDPDTFDFEPVNVSWLEIKYDPEPANFDNENLYPERYRKKFDTGRSSNESTPDPFCIGLISSISARHQGFCPASQITLKVFKYYRPENTRNVVNKGDVAQMDITMLFASEEEVQIDFSRVRGKCYVVFEKNLGGVDAGKWSMAGPDRFYFQQSYDPWEEELKEPREIFTLLGKVENDSPECDQLVQLTVAEYPPISRKLKCLDLFAGCGGLSNGLHQSDVAEAKWAVEKVSVAAKAFQLNNPQAEVFTMDVNDLLRDVLQGETRNSKGQVYPQKGEVELLVGGPPCQGFSGLNRFTKNDYSLFKNSLIVSMISYCDYYRPKYFVMENVRNLVSYAEGSVLKLVFRALLKMGYQVTVGVLQAGHYGVPQTRRRTIIMAAAPGEVLPYYPEPRHVFNPNTSHLAIVCGDKKFDAGLEYTDSAPYRTITVYDAMSDLPSIQSGFSKEEIPYDKAPETHFQRQVREDNTILRDHICKELAAIVQTRIDFIPKIKNADWRDLPNFEADCGNGQKCNMLLYTHHDRKYGRSKSGALRGVCSCAMGRPCEPTDRQFATLIPWSLPHSAKRNHNWLGLYGRIQWDEYFITTVTNPEPMGKQGKVLHPMQNRVVSVRECARSQGFKDTFMFYGDILEKHRQVGNAVPPPMGKAIGLEIRKSIAQKENTYIPPFKRSLRALVVEKVAAEVKEEEEEGNDHSDDGLRSDDDAIERKVDMIIREDAEEEPLRRCLWRKCKVEPKDEPDVCPLLRLPKFPGEPPLVVNCTNTSPPKLSSETLGVSNLPDVLQMPKLSPQLDVLSSSSDAADVPWVSNQNGFSAATKTADLPKMEKISLVVSDSDDIVVLD